MVVAVDEYPGRKVYTVDDSSGVCIECLIDVPRPARSVGDTISGADQKSSSKGTAAATTATTTITTTGTTEKKTITADTIPKVPEEVDVGTIVDIKGELTLFRDHKQIKILKTTVLRSTEQEVVFWEKLRNFRKDTLDKPWQLTEKQVRRCRKDEERRR